MSGLADVDPRFYFARYNAAICYLNLDRVERSLNALRELLDHHPGQAATIAEALATSSPKLQERMASTPGFAEGVIERCPELFLDQDPQHSYQPADSLEDEPC